MRDSTSKKLDTLIQFAFVLMIASIIYVFFKYVITLILPFLIAFMMVSALHPLIRWIHGHLNINQKLLSVALMALLYIAAGSLLFWLVLQVIFLMQAVLTGLPTYYQTTVGPALTSLWDLADEFLTDMPPAWVASVETVQNNLLTSVQNLAISISQKGVSLLTSTINAIPSFLIALIFTIMLSFFVSLQYDEVIAFISTQMSDRVKAFCVGLRSILKNTIFRYLRAYIILMAITFVELSAGLTLIRIPGAVGVAAAIAIFDALPVFGTGGILFPWAVIEFIQGSPGTSIQLLLLYGTVALVRNVIEPKVVGDQLGINPIVSLMAIYLGFRLFGVLGMIIFPMLAQILIALNQNGSIRLYKRSIAPAETTADEPPPAPQVTDNTQ